MDYTCIIRTKFFFIFLFNIITTIKRKYRRYSYIVKSSLRTQWFYIVITPQSILPLRITILFVYNTEVKQNTDFHMKTVEVK